MTGPDAIFTFLTGAGTHTGCVRSHNEDSIATQPDLGLWVVADGMGGHDAGDVASGLIVEELTSVGVPVSAQDQRARALQRLDSAHRRILTYASVGGLQTVGATLAALLIYDSEMTCIWAGDSRIYLWRKNILTRLTRDHSQLADLIDKGVMTEEEARQAPGRNVITRAIGVGDDAWPDIVSGTVVDGDRLLICSDGLTEYLSDMELTEALGQSALPQQVVERLIQETLARGARDNVSVIVVDCAARNIS